MLRGTRRHVRSPPGVRGAHCNQRRSTACVWSARPLIWTATRGSRASWPQVSLPASGESGGEGVSSVSTESATVARTWERRGFHTTNIFKRPAQKDVTAISMLQIFFFDKFKSESFSESPNITGPISIISGERGRSYSRGLVVTNAGSY